jgi:hypothetical protein
MTVLRFEEVGVQRSLFYGVHPPGFCRVVTVFRIQGLGYLIHALVVPPQLLKGHARVYVVDIRRTVRTRSRHHACVRGLLKNDIQR